MLYIPSWYEIGEEMRKKEVISIDSIRSNGTSTLDTRTHL